MMCLLNVYLVCNNATECKKDGCKKTVGIHFKDEKFNKVI